MTKIIPSPPKKKETEKASEPKNYYFSLKAKLMHSLSCDWGRSVRGGYYCWVWLGCVVSVSIIIFFFFSFLSFCQAETEGGEMGQLIFFFSGRRLGY